MYTQHSIGNWAMKSLILQCKSISLCIYKWICQLDQQFNDPICSENLDWKCFPKMVETSDAWQGQLACLFFNWLQCLIFPSWWALVLESSCKPHACNVHHGTWLFKQTHVCRHALVDKQHATYKQWGIDCISHNWLVERLFVRNVFFLQTPTTHVQLCFDHC